MTSEELDTIVRKHEMQRLELKESFCTECIETACAFTNAQGGFIVIGVDNDGNPSKRQLRFEGLRDYENKISTATEPCVAVDAEKVDFRGREVIVLRVIENPLKPVAFKGRCYIRKGSVNHQMTPTEIAECHLKSTGGSMDAVFVPGATKDDLNMDAVRKYMRRSVEKKRRAFFEDEDPWEVLLKLEWVKSESEITRAAYLMFAKDTQRKFSQAIVHSGAFRAGGALIVDSLDSKGNIQDQIDDAMAFIKRNIHCALVITPGKVDHDPMWDYPLEAVRETLANALCHRDYGAPYDIQVKIFEDSLCISSPGQLPFDMPMEFLMKPTHPSRPRNKIIAQAFFDMGIIERYGSGIKRIKGDCDKNGNPYPEWSDRYGEFATTYRPRVAILESAERTAERAGEIRERAEEKCERAERSDECAGENTERTGEDVERAGKINEWLAAAIPSGIRQDARKNMVSILKEIALDERITVEQLCLRTGLSERGVWKIISSLKASRLLNRIGPDKSGHWELVGFDP